MENISLNLIEILIRVVGVTVTIIGLFVKQKVEHRNVSVPEFHLHLYGSGSVSKIEGHVEKKDNRILIVESIQINDTVNNINRQFTKLLLLKGLNFPSNLFTKRKQDINVKVLYRTLNGDRFEYSQKMIQENRADGLFNVSLDGIPSIKKIGNLEVEKALSHLEEALKKANSVTGLASIRIPRIEATYKNWIGKNKEIYSTIHDSDYKGQLNAILVANNLSNYTIK